MEQVTSLVGIPVRFKRTAVLKDGSFGNLSTRGEIEHEFEDGTFGVVHTGPSHDWGFPNHKTEYVTLAKKVTFIQEIAYDVKW